MAVLNKIRQRSLFLILVIALALFSFVLADLFRNSGALTSKSQNIIATINGNDISREDFLRKVEVIQRQMGPSASSTQAMNRVWDIEVRRAILETEFNELGLEVENEQMKDLIKTRYGQDPTFLNEDGVFDEGKLNEFLANLKANAESDANSFALYNQWLETEANLAASAKEKAYYNMVKAGVTATVAEGKMEHELENNKVDIKFVQIPYSSIADSTITVSKTEISDYIKKHPKDFEVEATRDINYVLFKEEATLEDENTIQDELNKLLEGKVEYNEITKNNDTIPGFGKVKDNESFVNVIAGSDIKYDDRFLFKKDIPVAYADSVFNMNKGKIFGPYKDAGYFKLTKMVEFKQLPDSVKSRHILIPFVGAASADPSKVSQTESEAKATADSLASILKVNRSKFPDFVREFSSDQGSIEKEGRYDWYAYNTMVPEFRDFTFEGNKGDLGVVKTAFGFHIIEIEGQKDKQKVVKLATIGRKIQPSEKTIDNVFTDTSKFEIAIEEGDFQEVAKEKNYVVRPVNGIKLLQENIPGVGNQRAIVRWAFEEERNIGDSDRFNLPGGGYVVVQLSAKNEEGLMSVENASATVVPLVRKQKKAKQIRENVTGATVQEVASNQKQSVRTALAVNMKNPTLSGAGREPKVVGTAFGLQEGETSGLIDGNNGVYILEVTKVTPAIELDNYQAMANQITNKRVNSVNSSLFNALKTAADIEDNRAETVQ
ncbi:MAG: peptidylprolyl isomerase [Flavobacteriaceae bacterium]|nr:peptidylprolyl isomerase [Flavobacteriaceae bacterium]